MGLCTRCRETHGALVPGGRAGAGRYESLSQSFVHPRMLRDGGSMSTAGEVMRYEVLVERDVKVAMRDGIKLACDVYHPAHTGQAVTGTFPVILERTPYGKGITSRSEISRRHAEQPHSR